MELFRAPVADHCKSTTVGIQVVRLDDLLRCSALWLLVYSLAISYCSCLFIVDPYPLLCLRGDTVWSYSVLWLPIVVDQQLLAFKSFNWMACCAGERSDCLFIVGVPMTLHGASLLLFIVYLLQD